MTEILMATKAEVDALGARMDTIESDSALGSGASLFSFGGSNNSINAMVFMTSPAARGALAG